MPNTTFIFIDFINDIVDPNGKLAGKGYAAFDQAHGILDKAASLLSFARAQNQLILHVAVGFSAGYPEQPEHSPLFGAAKKYGALQLGTWGTQFHPKVAPLEGERVVIKHRVSAFFGTPLDSVLRNKKIDHVIIAGCSTDMAVQTTAREAHDRDYQVSVIGDCCIAANDDDHSQTLRMLAKIAQVVEFNALTMPQAA